MRMGASGAAWGVCGGQAAVLSRESERLSSMRTLDRYLHIGGLFVYTYREWGAVSERPL